MGKYSTIEGLNMLVEVDVDDIVEKYFEIQEYAETVAAFEIETGIMPKIVVLKAQINYQLTNFSVFEHFDYHHL